MIQMIQTVEKVPILRGKDLPLIQMIQMEGKGP